MKSGPGFLMAMVLFPLCAFSQTPWERCMAACLADGFDSATCMYEMCPAVDTTPDTSKPHVDTGQGNPLQLFSYKLMGPAPVINGSLMSRVGDGSVSDDKGEWKAACSRTLVLNDNGVVQLFLVNTAESLFVGITYEHGNNGDGAGVKLYYDEGAGSPPGTLDGPGDDKLYAPAGLANEQACAAIRGAGSLLLSDLSWKGSAWGDDADGATDFRAARAYFASDLKVHHTEMAVPLNNAKTDNAGNSDLDVGPDDAIGFFLQVIKTGSGGGTWYWGETNGNVTRPDTSPYWGRVQLSVKREFFTFYTGKTELPVTVDGAISEAAWDGAYQRDLVLSNYQYGILSARMWCVEDTAQNFIYVGVRVFDPVHNAGDYCQVYFEEAGENTTDTMRDFDLDGNAENSLRIGLDNAFSDLCWNVDQGLWVADGEAADAQAAKAGQQTGYADFEFKVARNGGAYDLDIPGNGLAGFLIRYHDADRATTERREFFWEYTTNNDAQLLDQQTKPYVYIATGWANLQLGGPSIQIVAPVDSQVVSGPTAVECIVRNATVSQVICYLSSDTTRRTTLTLQSGSYMGSLNCANAPSGPAFVVFRITAGGRVYERVVRVIVPIAVEKGSRVMPAVFGLAQNSPNPFGSATLIHFAVPGGKESRHVTLQVFNAGGKRVRTLLNGPVAGGFHAIAFDGLGDRAQPLPAGVYFYQMKSEGFSATKKLLKFSR